MEPVLRRFSLALAVVVAATACAASSAQTTGAAGSARDAVLPAAAHNDTSTPFNLVSLPALIAHRYDGRGLRLRHLVDTDVAARRYHITYRSGSLEISGQLSVPRRSGRFPLVVLAHGYEHPATYRSGAALAREEDFLTADGYVVLLPDYRNFGASDHDGAEPVAEPLGYPEDLVNAVLAVRRAHLPHVDASRVAVLGRSMGGGVAMSAVAARPGLFDALVLYAPVSSSAADNYRRWVAGSGELDARVLRTYGPPKDNPTGWRRMSVRSYLSRVDVPVQVHHGLDDAITPVSWSRATVAALRSAGQDVEYHEYRGEGHRFGAQWPTLARRMAVFLEENL